MAWLWGNSFDFYTDINDVMSDSNSHILSSSSASIVAAANTRFNLGQGISLSAATLQTLTFANSTTIWVNLNWQSTSYSPTGTAKGSGFRLLDGSSAQVGVWLRQDGVFLVTTGLYTGTVLASSPALFSSSSWHHIQIKVVINNTTGTVEIRKDGNTSNDWASGNINTRNGTVTAQCNSCLIGSGDFAQALDDIYIFNDQGAAPNTWQGDVRAVQQMPSSDSSQVWSRSTGSTNYNLVNELTSNQDTNYVLSNTVNAADAYNLAALSVTPSTIICIQERMCFRMDDTGPHTVKAQMISGGTTTNSATVVVATTYANQLMATYVTDPNTGLAWGGTAANAAKVGPVVVS